MDTCSLIVFAHWLLTYQGLNFIFLVTLTCWKFTLVTALYIYLVSSVYLVFSNVIMFYFLLML